MANVFLKKSREADRADYGSYLIKFLSAQLQPKFGSGFSVRQMNLYRQFYRVFPIVHTLRAQLSWSQYKLLLSVDDDEKWSFYIAEAIKNSRIGKLNGLYEVNKELESFEAKENL